MSVPPCLAPLFQEVAANDDDPRDPPALVVGAGDDICLSDEAVDGGAIVNAALAAMLAVFVVDKLECIQTKPDPFSLSPPPEGWASSLQHRSLVKPTFDHFARGRKIKMAIPGYDEQALNER
jgi:hypothetical protein